MVEHAVLFVDDDEFVLHSLRRALVQEPYAKIFAHSAYEAYDLIRKNDVHVVVTDVKMPVTDGVTFLAELKERYPDIVRMVLSGYAQVSQIIAAINRGEVFRYIPKPWDDGDELQRVLHEGLAFYDKLEQRRNQAKELDDLREEVAKYQSLAKHLNGRFPLCRMCHKIHRQDKDAWVSFAAYLSELSEARFQETICPACAGGGLRSPKR